MAEQPGDNACILGRGLDSPVEKYFGHHNYVVTNSKDPGDPKPTVHSFGCDAKMGKRSAVDEQTTGDWSKNTHAVKTRYVRNRGVHD